MQGLRPEILAGIPDEMYYSVRQLEDSFVISTPDLRRITNHFEGELRKGLSLEGGNIPMNVTWVMGYPTGEERGRYLTLDFGGTNIRVCDTHLDGRENGFRTTQEKYKFPLPLRCGTAVELWDFTADCVNAFLDKHDHKSRVSGSEKLPLAFTFSFPVTQTSIKNGILQNWTKAFDVSGVVGNDIVAQLEAAFERKNVPAIVVALVNDTVGVLMSSSYRDPGIKMSSIISTGCNAAYMENWEYITKIKPNLAPGEKPDDKYVAINTEYGAYDNQREFLPLTTFDETIDKNSPHPGSQIYEKMIAGMYLGEIFRLLLMELHSLGELFGDQDISALREMNSIDASFMSVAEADMTKSLHEISGLFKEKLQIELNQNEVKVCRYLVELVGTRAARLYACGIAAICRRMNLQRCRIGVDGPVFHHYTHFRERSMHALREILDWPHRSEDYVTFHDAEDGSGVGAALVAAIAMQNREGGHLEVRPGY